MCQTELKKLTGSEDISVVQYSLSLGDDEIRQLMSEYLGDKDGVSEFTENLITQKGFLGQSATAGRRNRPKGRIVNVGGSSAPPGGASAGTAGKRKVRLNQCPCTLRACAGLRRIHSPFSRSVAGKRPDILPMVFS